MKASDLNNFECYRAAKYNVRYEITAYFRIPQNGFSRDSEQALRLALSPPEDQRQRVLTERQDLHGLVVVSHGTVSNLNQHIAQQNTLQ